MRTIPEIASEYVSSRVHEFVEEQKQEVIKLIKKMEEQYTNKKLKFYPQNNKEFWLFTEERQRWMNFFGITEEDIKNGKQKIN